MSFARFTNLVTSSNSTTTIPIFSEDDVRRLFEQDFNRDRGAGHPIISTNEGFHNPIRAKRSIQRALNFGLGSSPSQFTSLASIAEHVGINTLAVEKLLPANRPRSAWIRHGDTIITRYGYQNLTGAMIETLKDGVLDRNKFCAKHVITTPVFNRLVQDYTDAVISTKGHHSDYLTVWSEPGQCFLTIKYRKYLAESIGDRLRAAEEPIDIEPSQLMGTPPYKLIGTVVEEQANTISGRTHIKDGQVAFVPYKYILGERDKKLEAIATGKINVLTEGDVSGLDLKSEGFKAFILDHLKGKAILLSSAAVSYAFLDKLVEDASLGLRKHNFATLPVSSLELDGNDTRKVTKSILEVVRQSQSSPEDLISSGAYGQHLILASYSNNFKSLIIEQAQKQAKTVGHKSATAKPSWLAIIDAIKKEHHDISDDLIAALLTNEIQTEATAAYSTELRRQHDKRRQAFARYWQIKVLARFELYERGLANLKEERLQKDLSNLTVEYLIDLVISEAFKKAETHDWIQGKAMIRHVDNLDHKLNDIKNNISSVENPLQDFKAALSAFNGGSNIDWPIEEDIQSLKHSQMKELAESMGRDEDSARLFLKLVLVLLSKHQPGTIYATGRFAPKLMKQFASSLDASDYEWLRKTRDAVRTGTLTAEDKAKMRNLASEASE